MISESLNSEVWERLFQGKTLDGLALGTNEGRLDLRGLVSPSPSVVQRYQTSKFTINEIEGDLTFRGVKWRNLDFAGSKLMAIRFMDSELENCRFDDCQFRDLRIWSTKLSATSFRGANLRKAVLGGVQNGQRNIFSSVDFSDADLRQTIYEAAVFHQCVFNNANLEKIDFQTCSFSECKFEGKLMHVLFYRRAFGGDAFPANEMVNVDFSDATLRFVEFRGLNLDRVQLPNNTEHILVKNYPVALSELISALQPNSDIGSRKLVAYFGVLKRWVGQNQLQGVLNIEDLVSIGGEEGLKLVRELLNNGIGRSESENIGNIR